MKPILFQLQIGDFTARISSYRFFGMLAAVMLVAGGIHLIKRYRVSVRETVYLTGGFALIFFAGARLLYTVLYYEKFLRNPLLIIEPALHNFTLYGGLFAVAGAGAAFCRMKRIPFLEAADLMAPWIAVSVGVLKIGCFFNGCCYGIPSGKMPGVIFPMFSPAYGTQLYRGQIDFLSASLPVYPTQLFEAAAAFFAALLAWRVGVKKNSGFNRPGIPVLFMIAVLSMGRLAVFFLREFPAADPLSNFIRGPVILGGTALISTGLLVLKLRGRDSRHEKGVKA